MWLSLKRLSGRYSWYEQLPGTLPGNDAHASRKRRPSCGLSGRTWTKLAAALTVLLTTAFIASRIYRNAAAGLPLRLPYIAWSPIEDLPPLYDRFHRYELQLPQHQANYSLSHSDRKYLWVANHARGVGWGNVMQEMLLNHQLALKAGRSFVFTNYTWDDSGKPYSNFHGSSIPSTIPVSALIRGPSAGASITGDAEAPLAVKKEYWDKVCPHPKLIRNADVVSRFDREPSAQELLDAWVEVLTSTEDPVFGNRDRLLAIWPSLSASPVLTEFGWSSLIELAFDQNREVFAPTAVLESYLTAEPVTTHVARYTPIPGLLALHVRRGDFAAHCRGLAEWGSTYVGFNSFHSFPDTLQVPPDTKGADRKNIYQSHCYPEIAQIVRKVQEVRRSEAGQGLRHMYVMTNGEEPWVQQLKAALAREGHWDSIATSRDIIVNAEQKYVKQAVDMLIGQRAQVFIGNGMTAQADYNYQFSSLTGQISMLRMANGFAPGSIRFW
ncbi:hypothetical protein POSPLADRAFT_1129442 [Postia placenta MAD-698-R-SB12]|uniref:Uncharacterized protein n=1 Tax=Postia placenta MAD-698-R-SB12 TaxID=670580 RepID=A0A1X6NDW7_9APHY|nr:hypothetical protein POSPLADRAFT_1129442 [Postia placenta MAD-698-R-SB12]OSX66839.1 hypothetical protein POSPLADRAFT_1129442 [Postia placenta MAD-698-R-SB12]